MLTHEIIRVLYQILVACIIIIIIIYLLCWKRNMKYDRIRIEPGRGTYLTARSYNLYYPQDLNVFYMCDTMSAIILDALPICPSIKPLCFLYSLSHHGPGGSIQTTG